MIIGAGRTAIPKPIADLILKLADGKALPSHLLLARDAENYPRRSDEERAELADKWNTTSMSVDFGPGSVPHQNFK